MRSMSVRGLRATMASMQLTRPRVMPLGLPRPRPASALAAARQAMVQTNENALLASAQPVVKDVTQKSKTGTFSLARSELLTEETEAAVNAQLNVELTISHIYLSLSAYFARDNVALPGLAKYFGKESESERKHAGMLMDFLNTRGGRVILRSIPEPNSELDGAQEKGDALAAMELSLSLEKLNYAKLNDLNAVANEQGDFNLSDLVDDMMKAQADDVKEVADYVTQLVRVGQGHGTWAFDKDMLEEME